MRELSPQTSTTLNLSFLVQHGQIQGQSISSTPIPLRSHQSDSLCVRVQNRWFLVEFLFPSSQPVPSHTLTSDPTPSPLDQTTSSAPESSYIPPPPSKKKRKNPQRKPKASTSAGTSSTSSSDDDSAEDSDEDPNDEEIHWPALGPLPLLLPPPPNPVTGKPKKLDERAIYQALRTSVVQVFGDDGWGRVGGGTSGESVFQLVARSLRDQLASSREGGRLGRQGHPSKEEEC